MQHAMLEAGEGRTFANGVGTAQVKIEQGQSPGFAMFESELAPASAGPPPHLHDAYDEAFYVLEGRVRFCVDEEVRDCAPGSVVFVPRGSLHSFSNASDRPSRVLVVLTPPALALVEAMGAVAGDPVAARALWTEHRSRVQQAKTR